MYLSFAISFYDFNSLLFYAPSTLYAFIIYISLYTIYLKRLTNLRLGILHDFEDNIQCIKVNLMYQTYHHWRS